MSNSNSEEKSKCTVALLISAAHAAYVLKKDNVDPNVHSKLLNNIAKYGYEIANSIAPIKSEGTGPSPLAAVCLKPKDLEAPLVISFRGTTVMGDVFSDIMLATGGVVEKKFRDAAFDFYQQVRKKNPDRQIIITGHSLGGHLAQYVATKAYNTDLALQKSQLVQVRTFNTAPANTSHNAVFKKVRPLLSQFVNYSLSPDAVSNLPLQKYTGNTFVFPSKKRTLNSHRLDTMEKELPPEILSQEVTAHSNADKKQTMLVELIQGFRFSYQCRVKGQFFSRFRAGAKNVIKIEEKLPEIIKYIESKEYDQAISKIKALQKKLNGKTSIHITDVLMLKTMEAQEAHESQKKAVMPNTSSYKEQQQYMKSELTKVKAKEKDATKSEHEELMPRDNSLS